MAVTMRLARHGNSHRPFYHIVAADKKMPRNGRYIEKLGYYDPNANPSVVELKEDRVQHWYGKGACMSPTVAKLLKVKKVALTRDILEKKPKS